VFKKVCCPLLVLARNKISAPIIGNLSLPDAKISKILKIMNLFCLIIIKTLRLFHQLISKMRIIIITLQEGKVLTRSIKSHRLMIFTWQKIIKIIINLMKIHIVKSLRSLVRNFTIRKIRRTLITLKLLKVKIKIKVTNHKRIYSIKKIKNLSKVKIKLKKVNYLFRRKKN
jgi:hypothetical protein